MPSKAAIVGLLLALAHTGFAKTDIAGCVSSASGGRLTWWVPETGELCEFLDCGGGRAPPKTNVPGCGNYKGTETYSPSYLPGWGPNGGPAATTSSEKVHSATTIPKTTSAKTTSVAAEPTTLITSTGPGTVSTSTDRTGFEQGTATESESDIESAPTATGSSTTGAVVSSTAWSNGTSPAVTNSSSTNGTAATTSSNTPPNAAATTGFNQKAVGLAVVLVIGAALL